jgi:hypothetical protein
MIQKKTDTNSYPTAVAEGLKELADQLDQRAFPGAAEELRTLAARGPKRTPFGYYWQHVFAKTGEVVNSGFFLHPYDDTEEDVPSVSETPVSNMPGFVQRVRPLYV